MHDDPKLTITIEDEIAQRAVHCIDEMWVCKIFRVNSKFNKRAYKPIIV